MKKLISILLVSIMLSMFTASLAYAQSSNQLQLGMSRDFGYGGFGGDIQGIFTIKIINPPANLSRVVFYLDSTVMGEVTAPPFSLQFNTDSYSLGNHTLSAVGYTSDGTQLTSDKLERQFVPASAAGSTIVKIVVPIVGLLIVAALLAVFIPLLLNRGKTSSIQPGTPRNYGIGGGAICPKCGRPFPIRLWFINLGLSKIDRCPYCGKWSLVRQRSLAELRAAEAAELAQSQATPNIAGETEADKLKKDLDDSRYQNF